MAGHDLDITRNGELMIAQAEGVTDEGVEFLDGYMPATEYTVVDSGRILVPDDAVDALLAAARESALTWEVIKQ